MTRQDALRAMTASGAYLTFEENYLAIPEDEIKNIRPVMTMVGGKVVHQR